MFNMIVLCKEGRREEELGRMEKRKAANILSKREEEKTATNHSDINFYMDDRIFYQVHKYKLITQHVETVHYI